jgi:hypothetical protein
MTLIPVVATAPLVETALIVLTRTNVSAAPTSTGAEGVAIVRIVVTVTTVAGIAIMTSATGRMIRTCVQVKTVVTITASMTNRKPMTVKAIIARTMTVIHRITNVIPDG